MNAAHAVAVAPAVDDELAPPAEPLRRLVARVADAAVVFTILWAMVVLRVFSFVPAYADDVHPRPWGSAFLPTVTFAVLSLVYEIVFLRWNKGQTPGRDWMHVRVVDGDGRDPRVPTALRRALLPSVLVVVPPPLLGASLVVALGVSALSTSRRSAFDVLAGTTVVRWDRDAHESADARTLRKRPPSLGMFSGLIGPGRGADDWVAPDPFSRGPAERSPS